MKVRIRRTPPDREIDGVALDRLEPGAIRHVPASIGSWLIVEGYAVTEMRQTEREDEVPPPFEEQLIFGRLRKP